MKGRRARGTCREKSQTSAIAEVRVSILGVLMGRVLQVLGTYRDIARFHHQPMPMHRPVDDSLSGRVHGRPCKQQFHRSPRQPQKRCGRRSEPNVSKGGR